MRVLVTGAQGFIGSNLCSSLRQRDDILLLEIDIGNPTSELDSALEEADVVFHLAGINRPKNSEDFILTNTGLTETLCSKLIQFNNAPKIIFASSIQAELNNPYGASKKMAEMALEDYCHRTGADCIIYRLKNLYGKWCRPNYNSVVATFCNNISHNLPIQISDPTTVVDLTYIDDVVAAFLCELDRPDRMPFRFAEPLPSRSVSLEKLATLIRSFHDHRNTLVLQDYSDPFIRSLYATYLSYLEIDAFAYQLNFQSDDRGSLAEFIKSSYLGQIFISRTRPGIIRGNHYHNTKTEKFIVVQGEGIIRLRHIGTDEIIEYQVNGEEYQVVDIPPGYTHSIENVGDKEMVTLFWASEPFEPDRPDTWFEPVLRDAQARLTSGESEQQLDSWQE
ncbi:NAD-dependent epimerase/dehydratase family protein [Candidatus Zixiibacteriota bacterium]